MTIIIMLTVQTGLNSNKNMKYLKLFEESEIKNFEDVEDKFNN